MQLNEISESSLPKAISFRQGLVGDISDEDEDDGLALLDPKLTFG